MAQENSQESCPSYSYQNVSVGRRVEERLVLDRDATTPYQVVQRSQCKQPCPGDYWAFATVGRRQERVWMRNVVVTPETVARETGCRPKCHGDYWVYKSVGRRQERVWMQDVALYPAPPAPLAAASMICADCPLRTVRVGGIPEQHSCCVVDGLPVDCSKTPPECPDCAHRASRINPEPQPLE